MSAATSASYNNFQLTSIGRAHKLTTSAIHVLLLTGLGESHLEKCKHGERVKLICHSRSLTSGYTID